MGWRRRKSQYARTDRNGAYRFALLAVLFGAAFVSCRPATPGASASSSPVDTRDRNQNQATVRYAKHFVLEYHQGYKVLRVLSPWRGAKTGFTYVLVPRGASVPKTESGAMVIPTPVRRFVVTSTVYIPYLSMLGLEDTLVGVAQGSKITTPSVAKRYAEGEIVEIGNGAKGMVRSLNMERLISLQPDLVMLYGTGDPTYDFHEQLFAAGIPFTINAEYMESSPLGAAEWIKFAAAFFDKDAEAEEVFAGIAARYEQEAARARSVETRPTVFSGIDYHGVWYMPGGDSYPAQFATDAGARYLWDDDHSQGDMTLTMEAVMLRARQADFWMDVFDCRSLAELAAIDDRYRLVRAFQEKHVYNNDLRINAAGGNDFWETGIARPDLVLADLIHIFHPELEPGHKFIWYRQLPEKAGH